jgi:hypothetical protein
VAKGVGEIITKKISVQWLLNESPAQFFLNDLENKLINLVDIVAPLKEYTNNVPFDVVINTII